MPPLDIRFWRKVEKGDDCWNWIGSKLPQGYGKMYYSIVSNKPLCEYAHRISWELHKGPIPRGKCVLHKCDNPSCVNPDHLFLGTYADNSRDRESKNRGYFGSEAHIQLLKNIPRPNGSRGFNTKLKESDVIEIRDIYKRGKISSRKLAKAYNISYAQISRITRREQWTHI